MREENLPPLAQIDRGGGRVPIGGGRIPLFDLCGRSVSIPHLLNRSRNVGFDGDFHGSLSFLPDRIEQELDVAAQVINAGCGDLCVVFGLGQYERALEDCLRVQGEAFCSPLSAKAALPHRLGDVGLYLLRVPADAGFASRSNARARLEGFLHHRADKASELGNVAGEQLFSEVEVAEDTRKRICVQVIRSSGKKLARNLRPVAGGPDTEVFLALEVVEEGALGDPGGGAEIFDAGGCVTLGADDPQCSLQNLRPCIRRSCHLANPETPSRKYIPTGWYVAKMQKRLN